MNAKDAEALAEALIRSYPSPPDSEFVVTDSERVSHTWVVYWQSLKYLETRDPSDALVGNGPILVSDAGTVAGSGTALPIAEYVEDFEAGRAPYTYSNHGRC